MKQTLLRRLAVGALVAGSAVAMSQSALAEQKSRLYSVTIANAMRGQPLAPGLIISHDSGFSLFELNDAPTFELATMAETGDPGPLAASLVGVRTADVLPGTSGPPGVLTLPSESNSREIFTDAKFLTVVGMLAATNDAFYAVHGVALPKRGKITVYASAYDAGSEANNELDGQVPATPSGNTDGVLDGDGEGFIHIHSGIHGVGDLAPAQYDWRNPVVEITIERLGGDS